MSRPIQTSRHGGQADLLINSGAIVRSARWQTSYPLQYVSRQAQNEITRLTKERCNKSVVEGIPVFFRVLEAYLAVTGRTLSFTAGHFAPEETVLDFFGALYSKKFLYASDRSRYVWARTWRELTRSVCPRVEAEVPRPSQSNTPGWYIDASHSFDKIRLNKKQVDYWHGWMCVNNSGNLKFFDFRGIYERFGKSFAEGLGRACWQFFNGRAAQDLPLVQAFADYLVALPRHWSRKKLLSSTDMSKLLSSFLKWKAEDFDSRNLQYSTLREQWIDFTFFLKTYVCNGKLLAKRLRIKRLPTNSLDSAKTHRRVKEDGVAVITKLLTELPLYVSNKRAVQLLHEQISDDLEAIRSWAQFEVEKLWLTYVRRNELAKAGKPKRIRLGLAGKSRGDNVQRGAPNWEANACATFEHYGFRPSQDGHLKTLFPDPLEDFASSTLALPTKGALIPHMALLVLSHPSLTTSFFQKVVLFDQDERTSGVTESDVGWVLDGVKLRKGHEKAQQTIHLSEADFEIVRQIIELTEPLRAYLKTRGDPSWRLLFLHCGKGFSYPAAVFPSEDTSYRRRGYIYNGGTDSALSASFRASGCIPEKIVERLTASFSLNTLRATVAVRHYIKTPNIRKLAELLGHDSFDMRLVRRYLPAPLLDFFQNRWVRLFQCGLILEAMGDSPYILSAAGFANLEEMAEFLLNHALKWRPRAVSGSEVSLSNEANKMDDEVVFAVSVDNLKILESLRLAALDIGEDHISPHARVWIDYANGLFDFIEKSAPPRDDYIEMLALAREQASSGLISKEAIYA